MLKVIKEDLVQAMKDKNVEKKDLLKIVRANITNYAIEKRVAEEDLANSDIITILAKEKKQQEETLEGARQANREDLIAKANRNIEILTNYLPKQMDEDEIEDVILDVLAKLGIEHPTNKDKGVIMKELMPKVKGKADGKLVNKILTEKMS